MSRICVNWQTLRPGESDYNDGNDLTCRETNDSFRIRFVSHRPYWQGKSIVVVAYHLAIKDTRRNGQPPKSQLTKVNLPKSQPEHKITKMLVFLASFFVVQALLLVQGNN